MRNQVLEEAHTLIRDLLLFSSAALLVWTRGEGTFGDETHFEYSIRFTELSRILSIRVFNTKPDVISRSNHVYCSAQQGHQVRREERACKSKLRFDTTASAHSQPPRQTVYRKNSP